jgi:hypothetical protein
MHLIAEGPCQVHVIVSSLFEYRTTIGCTGLAGINAPGLKVIKHDPLVVVPSGNT